MKKPIGYKVTGITHFPQEPSFSSAVAGIRLGASDGVRSAPLLKDGSTNFRSLDDRTARPHTNSKKPTHVTDLPKTLVEATEEQKIGLIRNMIRDELAKEKKAQRVSDNQQMLLEQIQHISMDVTTIQSRLRQLEEGQDSNIEQLARQCAQRLQEARETKDSIRSRQKTDDVLGHSIHEIKSKLKDLQGTMEAQMEAVQSRLGKTVQDVTARMDREFKLHSSKTATSNQLEHPNDNPKKLATKLSNLEASVGLILKKLEDYNQVLDEIKDMNPQHSIKLTEIVGRVAEENKERKKEIQELRRLHDQLDRSIMNSSEKMDALEGELYTKFGLLQSALSQKDTGAAIRHLADKVQQESDTMEQLHRDYYHLKEELEQAVGKMHRLEALPYQERPNQFQPNKQALTAEVVERMKRLITARLNDMLGEFNSNFKCLDDGLGQTRDAVFELTAVSKILTQKLNEIYAAQKTAKQDFAEFVSFRQEIAKASEGNCQQISELLQREMSCQHELRLLKDRLDQLEVSLSYKRGGTPALDYKMNQMSRRLVERPPSLHDEKIFDQLNMLE